MSVFWRRTNDMISLMDKGSQNSHDHMYTFEHLLTLQNHQVHICIMLNLTYPDNNMDQLINYLSPLSQRRLKIEPTV